MSTMIKVCIASQNPVKIACVQKGFEALMPKEQFEFIGISVPSGVTDQPMTDEETLIGAKTRAKNAQADTPKAQYWVGIEGGVDMHHESMEAFAWIVIRSKYQVGKSKTATFTLPLKIAELVNQGVELGHADDKVFKRTNSKQKDGAIGILTNGLIDRTNYYYPAVVMALIPFVNEELYR